MKNLWKNSAFSFPLREGGVRGIFTSALELVQPLPESTGTTFERTPINLAVSQAVGRVQMSTEQTISETNSNIAEMGGDLALRAQREGNSLSHTIKGTYNLPAPTEDFWTGFLDPLGWASVNPWKYLVGTFNSEGPLVSALDKSATRMMDSTKSPLIYENLSHQYLMNNYQETVELVSDGAKSGMSLVNLDFLEGNLDAYFKGAIGDFNRFESEMLQRLKTEEPWKQLYRKWITFGYQWRVEKLASRIRQQLEDAYNQLKSNIESAREAQRRLVDNVASNIIPWVRQLERSGNQEQLDAFGAFSLDLMHSPEDFLNGNNFDDYGINWEKLFIPKGIKSDKKILLLDAIYRRSLKNAIDVVSMQMAGYNYQENVSLLKERSNTLEDNIAVLNLPKLQKISSSSGLEKKRFPASEEDKDAFIIGELSDAFNQPPHNIIIEEVIFNQNVGIYQSNAEKIAQLFGYIQSHPEFINGSSSQRLNKTAISYFNEYLFQKESALWEEIASSSTVTEDATWSNRILAIESAEGLNQSISGAFDIIENLHDKILSQNANLELRKLQDIVDNFNAFKQRMGSIDDERSFVSKLPTLEKEAILEVLSLQGLVDNITDNIPKIRDERNKFEELLEKIGGEEGKRFMKKQETRYEDLITLLADIAKKNEGGVGKGSGANFSVGGEGDGSAGLETSASNIQQLIDKLLLEIRTFQGHVTLSENYTATLPGSTRSTDTPFVKNAENMLAKAKLELQKSQPLDSSENDELSRLWKQDLLESANKQMGEVVDKIVRSSFDQQWQSLSTKERGSIQMESFCMANTTNQTKLNSVGQIFNALEFTDLSIVRSASDDPDGAVILEARSRKNYSGNGNEVFLLKVLPPVRGQSDVSNVFVWKRKKDQPLAVSMQASAIMKGAALSYSTKTNKLDKNPAYQHLWEKAGLTEKHLNSINNQPAANDLVYALTA